MEVQINYIAVVIAMLSSLMVGFIWYSKPVFGKDWARLTRVKLADNGKGAITPIAATFIVSLITAYVIANLSYLSNAFFQNDFLQDALTTAFWLWLGLVAARLITHDAFERRSLKLTAINLGNEFVTIMLMGLIIGLFGV